MYPLGYRNNSLNKKIYISRILRFYALTALINNVLETLFVSVFYENETNIFYYHINYICCKIITQFCSRTGYSSEGFKYFGSIISSNKNKKQWSGNRDVVPNVMAAIVIITSEYLRRR